jgi:Zn-dependent oligopeptidase
VRRAKAQPGATPSQLSVLACAEKTFMCYLIESAAARAVKEELTAKEGALEGARNALVLGYQDPQAGAFVPASSVLLRTKMRTEKQEAVRRACYKGVRTIGPSVTPGLSEVVKMRNQLAKAQGFTSFYDMKCTQAEGFGEETLFGILDGLEERTRPLMEAARARVAAEKGAAALEPWNLGYALSGDVTAAQDPYFPFEDAVDAWARSFAALGIQYRGATMRLDLLDREGKYSNGFCHWPQVAYINGKGTFVPSQTNFTSLATPSAVGSGQSALETLMHEGGHAAHFANVLQPSPFFGQERAPTSVAYAETQSMFLDSLVGDAAWLARYALNREGQPMPWTLLEQGLRAKRPYAVLDLRAMLAVPYFERELYRLPDSELTAQRVAALADEVEMRIQGGLSPRPLLSVPHILADESSCYYHGYVLAEMAVWQTRAHMLHAYGRIVDEPRVGAALASVYWAPGNSQPFLGLVEALTGAPLSGNAWVTHLQEDLEAVVASEKAAYDVALRAGPARKAGQGADLNMRVLLVHGAQVVADSGAAGGANAEQRFALASDTFKAWVRARA